MADGDEMELVVTEVERIPEIVAQVRTGFHTHKTLPREYRMQQLRNLLKMVNENETKICEALWHDLRKNEMEAVMMETNYIRGDIVHHLNNLEKWMAPEYVETDLLNKLNSVYIYPEPFGVVLNIAPWNYPFQLCIGPVIGAIAAGNAAIIKPSEIAVATSNILAELVPQYLDNECYAVVTGGIEVSQALLKERFDYLMYTGSTVVGKIVMRQAAEHLTPVTLELGGKSPCIVCDDANIAVAGRRIAWGKWLNAGQTCIAPDYILCTPRNKDKLLEAMKTAIVQFFGEDPKSSKDYGRIINTRHFQRLTSLLQSSSGTVFHGGETDDVTRYISPTLLSDVTPDDVIMKDEIFGPLLPFVTVEDVDQAITFVNDREKPLAFYVFTESKKTFEKIRNFTSAGGICHNDTLMQSSLLTLPFGGVGNSGCGAYHGKFSFDTFTHRKPVLSTGTGLDSLNKLRCPPFSRKKLSRLRWLLTPSERRRFWPSKLLLLFLLMAIIAVVVQVFGVPKWVYRL